MLKSGFPKNPSYTVVLQREKLPPPSNFSAEATFVSFKRGRIEGGRGKERAGRKVGK